MQETAVLAFGWISLRTKLGLRLCFPFFNTGLSRGDQPVPYCLLMLAQPASPLRGRRLGDHGPGCAVNVLAGSSSPNARPLIFKQAGIPQRNCGA